jgi:hypothetical protein
VNRSLPSDDTLRSLHAQSLHALSPATLARLRQARHGATATHRVCEGAKGLEWTVPSAPQHHTYTVPPEIRDGALAHGDFVHGDYE